MDPAKRYPRSHDPRAGVCVLVLAACFAASTVHAQGYPAKPIRLITESPTGAISDIGIRAVIPGWSTRLGQPVVLESRAGANGIIAMDACVKAAPDGYTACTVSSNIMSFNPNVFSNLSYDPEKDFRPVSRTMFLVGGLIATSGLAASSVKELQDLAFAKPGSLNFGTLGPGSVTDVFRQHLAHLWKTEIVGIPYKGGNLVAQAIVVGEVQIGSFGIGSIISQVQAGKAKILAVNAPQRLKQLPDVPLFTETGIEGGEPRVFWGISFPARTPDAIVARMNTELVRSLREPKVVEFLESRFLVPAPTSAEEFAAFMRKDREEVGQLVRKYNVPRQ